MFRISEILGLLQQLCLAKNSIVSAAIVRIAALLRIVASAI
jgi:hypothetical protein